MASPAAGAAPLPVLEKAQADNGRHRPVLRAGGNAAVNAALPWHEWSAAMTRPDILPVVLADQDPEPSVPATPTPELPGLPPTTPETPQPAPPPGAPPELPGLPPSIPEPQGPGPETPMPSQPAEIPSISPPGPQMPQPVA